MTDQPEPAQPEVQPVDSLRALLIEVDAAHDAYSFGGTGRLSTPPPRWTCQCRDKSEGDAYTFVDSPEAGVAAATAHVVDAQLAAIATWLDGNAATARLAALDEMADVAERIAEVVRAELEVPA